MTTPIQSKRHEARSLLIEAVALLEGQPGLTGEQQIERIAKALTNVQQAVQPLGDAAAILTTRDFAAYQAEKDEEKAAEEAHQGYSYAEPTTEDDYDEEDQD